MFFSMLPQGSIRSSLAPPVVGSAYYCPFSSERGSALLVRQGPNPTRGKEREGEGMGGRSEQEEGTVYNDAQEENPIERNEKR